MSGLDVLIWGAVGWLAVVLLFRWLIAPLLSRGPGGNPVSGLLWQVIRIWTRVLHRPTCIGAETARGARDPGSLIVVSNHTGSIDPFLIQAACRFEIRWMMAADLMFEALDPLWKQQKLIRVARDGSDSGPAREAIRHVKAGGVLGIFPEGRIVAPPRQVWPFLAGVGLIVARTKAPVLLAWVSQTPETNDWAGSLITPSHARVEFVEVPEVSACRGAAEITNLLRERLQRLSGWPLNDDPPPPARPEDGLELG